MARSADSATPTTSANANKRALVILVAVLAVAGGYFAMTQFVMKAKPVANPVAPLLAQPAKAKAAVAAQNAATSKLGAATGGVPAVVGAGTAAPAASAIGTTKAAPVPSGPAPNLTRDPFVP